MRLSFESNGDDRKEQAMTQVTSSTATGQAAAGSPEPSTPGESRVAHFARDSQSSVCLCGYVGVREATPEEARLSGYCVVCFEVVVRISPAPSVPRSAPPWRRVMDWDSVQRELERAFDGPGRRSGSSRVVERTEPFRLAEAMTAALTDDESDEHGDLEDWPGSVAEVLQANNVDLVPVLGF